MSRVIIFCISISVVGAVYDIAFQLYHKCDVIYVPFLLGLRLRFILRRRGSLVLGPRLSVVWR